MENTKGAFSGHVFDGLNKDKASQILRALDGLRIWEAEEILDACKEALTFVRVKGSDYSLSKSDSDLD